MRKIVIFFLFTLLIRQGFSQIVPSSCEPPVLLETSYDADISNMALRRMYEVQSPDTSLIAIPQTWKDTILEGMAAILNAVSIPERDSVFNLYCVHDLAPHNLFIYNQLIVFVDTSYAWTQAWQNMQTLTGNPAIDNLLVQYQYQIVQFSHFSFGSMALLESSSLWNIYALIDQIEQVQGVLFAEPNALIGTAGRIDYVKQGTQRFYNFEFQWNDCFDGCDNSHTWKFSVLEDCSVEFLGTEDWGFFGIEPLPAPANCNLFSGLSPSPFIPPVIQISPNPACNYITLGPESVQIEKLQLFNPFGALVLEKNASEIRYLDVSAFNCGLYTLKIYTSGHHTSVHKLLIHR